MQPYTHRIRRCEGNKRAWCLVALRKDGSEINSYGGFKTAMSIDSLLRYAGSLLPGTSDVVQIVYSPLAEEVDAYRPRNAREAAFRAGWEQAGSGEWHRVPRAGESHDPETFQAAGLLKVWEPTAVDACRRDGLAYAEK